MTPTDTPAPTDDEIRGVVEAFVGIEHHHEESHPFPPCSGCDSEALLTIQLNDWGFSSPARAGVYAKLLRSANRNEPALVAAYYGVTGTTSEASGVTNEEVSEMTAVALEETREAIAAHNKLEEAGCC